MKRFLIATIFLLASTSSADISNSGLLQIVRIDQHLGQTVPLDLQFTDDQGQDTRLANYMTNKPVILVMAYFTCPNLCPMLQRHLTEGLNGIALVAGRDFDVVIASIDPADTIDSAARQKLSITRAYRNQNADGWHYLTGGASQIATLEESVGFHCTPDPQNKQFRHALGAIVISPGGKISHYFLGVDSSPADLEAALKDAAANRTTPSADPAQQYCLDYSPSASRYGRIAVHTLQTVAAVWVLLLLGYIGRELHRERKKEAPR